MNFRDGKDGEIGDVPNSPNIALRCCTALNPLTPSTEYDTIIESLK